MRVLLFVCSILLILEGLCGLRCELGSFYKLRKDGREKCRRCRPCRAGQGWNMSVEVRNNSDHGFLECYPCELCPTGYYRRSKSAFQRCNPCRLDCRTLNRYNSVRCGFDNPGHCGECITGFEPESSEPNNRCYEISIVSESTTARPNQTELPKGQSVHVVHVSPIVYMTITIVGLIVLGLVVLFGFQSRRPAGASKASLEVSASDDTLLSSSSSNTVAFQSNDFEMDGPTPVPARNNGRLQCAKGPNAGPTRITYPVRIVDRILEKDDEILSVVSRRISGSDKVRRFFSLLNIHRSKIDPHKEMWMNERISHSDYIFKVLIEWTEFSYPKNTLCLLCSALTDASFGDVVTEILNSEKDVYM